MRVEVIHIENDTDHAEAMALVSRLMGTDDSAERARLKAQAILVADYELHRWPMKPATSVDIEQYLREQRDQESDDYIFADIATVVQAEPRAVVCLLSALAYHGIGRYFADGVWIYLPKGVVKPRVGNIPILAMRERRSISDGISEVEIAGIQVKMTDPVRSVVDCFRHFHGDEQCLDALYDILNRHRATASEVADMAMLCGMWSKIEPYLVAMDYALSGHA